MRVRGWAAGAVVGLALAFMGLTGCENTQGTSANPDLTRDTVDYKGNDDPQNTGAGAGAIGKPPEGPTSSMGGESASQAAIKGTDNQPDPAPAQSAMPNPNTPPAGG